MTHGGYVGYLVWNCQRDSGTTPAVGVRITANRRTESRAIDATTRTGCWCSTAASNSAISVARWVPGGIAFACSGDAPECSSQSGPCACCLGVGHRDRTAAGSFSVAQSAAAASRPLLLCPRASQKCPV